ncbi:copper resistance protein B [Sphingomonas sp. G-3-2-10]|uniref:copper resistance protein B n=1 Tax=Sphingomonas sp. G-3-2-10 TaxID=2728838 RepID=UPI00146AB314|nr:copper resistance protein B [Sphingomonas sp. G-3-2-10]NML04320.1 copper resistance protein B [Sphingomonas sp. G-3-2-10]
MKARFLIGIAPFVLALPATAQDHSGHAMPGTAAPAPAPTPAPAKPADPHAGHRPATPAPAPADPHAGHAMPAPAPSADPHAGHVMTGEAAQDGKPLSGTDLPPGDATAPAPEPGRAADRYWGAEAMAESERNVRREHGDGTFTKVMIEMAEVHVRSGDTGYRWQGEAWYGGDLNRLWLKSEGEGVFRHGLEGAEIQALYSRALDPYWNLQAGVRQDFGPGPRRTYATLAIEGLAPYWFELEGSLFLSDKGDLLARAEGSYDQRITQNLVIQPRFAINLSAQDMPANGIGAGLSNAELGLRLRYEEVREFAPYIGVSWERSFGRTADFARARGEDTGGVSFVVGVRTWF